MIKSRKHKNYIFRGCVNAMASDKEHEASLDNLFDNEIGAQGIINTAMAFCKHDKEKAVNQLKRSMSEGSNRDIIISMIEGLTPIRSNDMTIHNYF